MKFRINNLLFFLFFFLSNQLYSQESRVDSIFVKVKYEDRPFDALYLRIVQSTYTNEGDFLSSFNIGARDKEGCFCFNIPLDWNKYGYFYVSKKPSFVSDYTDLRISPMLPIKGGDSLSLGISSKEKKEIMAPNWNNHFQYKISGRGSLKDSIFLILNQKYADFIRAFLVTSKNGRVDFTNKDVDLIHSGRSFIQKYKERLDINTYESLQTYFYYRAANDNLQDYTARYDDNPNEYKKDIDRILGYFVSNFPDEMLDPISPEYLKFQFRKICINLNLFSHEQMEDHVERIIDRITEVSDPTLRDWLILKVFSDITRIKNFKEIYEKAHRIVTDKYVKERLEMNAARLKNIDQLSWKVSGENGEQIDISKFKNKVVIIDFWFTGCGACSFYYKTVLSKVEAYFQNNKDVVFLSVNADKDKIKWKNSIKSGLYTNKHALNAYTDGLGFKHPILRQLNIGLFPTMVLFDKSGNMVAFNPRYTYEQFIDSIKQRVGLNMKTNL